MTGEIKPITIITTIHPPKKGRRPVTVAAAPEGELPLMLAGDFAARHALADQAYGALLKRKPQIVKAGVATKQKKSRRKSPRKLDMIETAQAAMSAAVGSTSMDAEKADQIGLPGDLPAIENDIPQMALPLESPDA